MPYGITQYYLPPGRGDIPAFTPAEAGTRVCACVCVRACVCLPSSTVVLACNSIYCLGHSKMSVIMMVMSVRPSVHQSVYPSMCVQSPTRCCVTWRCVSRRRRSVRTTVRTAVISMQDMLMTATARPMRGTARRRGAKPTPGGRSTSPNQPSSASSNSPTPQTPTKVAYVRPSPPPGSQILSLTR